MLAVSHEARGLHAAACHGSQLGEGHTNRSHACVLTVRDAHAVGKGLDSADTLEASAGGHGLLNQGVEGYVLQGSLGEFLHCLIDILILADPLVDDALLGDHLAGSLGIQLVGRLCVQPGYGSAQAQTLRSHHAYVARREGLAHDAAVVYVYALVCQGRQSLVTLVEHRDRQVVAQLGTLGRIGDDGHLALVHDSRELALYAGVQHLADMFQTEACLIGILAYTDADHVALSGVHHSLYAVQVGVELTLEYCLEVALHGLSGYIYDISDALLASLRHLVDVRSDKLDLVILHLGGFLGAYQLEAVHTGAVELYLHVAAADDLALESGSEGYRNVDLGDLQLDIAGFQRSRVELAHILLYNQALRHAEGLLVGDNREAKSDGSCAAGYDHFVERSESVYEGRHTLKGVLHQACRVARLNIAEDQSRADSYGNYVNHRGYVLSKRNHTHVGAHLQALLYALVNDAAHQSHQDALSLIGFYQLHAFLSRGGCSQDNGYARDIAGYQRHAQFTDGCVRQMACLRSRVGRRVVQILQNLDELCAQGCSHAAHESVMQSLLSGHQGLYHAESLFELS